MTAPDCVEVVCLRAGCVHGFTAHEEGRRCLAAGCSCRGFQWVDPGGAAGGYSARPFWPGVPLTDAEAELLGPEPTDYA